MFLRIIFTLMMIIPIAVASCGSPDVVAADDAGVSESTGNPNAAQAEEPDSTAILNSIGDGGSALPDETTPLDLPSTDNPYEWIDQENNSSEEPKEPEAISHTFTFMISSNTVSNFTPCGCRSGKWGGMPRRGAIFSEVEDEVEWPVIYIDTGDVTQGSTNVIQQLKDKYIFQAYQVMDYDFVNVGVNELKLGYEELARIGDEYNIPWTSVNIYGPNMYPIPPAVTTGVQPQDEDTITVSTSEEEGIERAPTNLFQPYRIIEPVGIEGFRIGFIGAMIHAEGRLNPMSGSFSFEPYADAIARTLAILRNDEEVDLVVLVCDADNFEGTDKEMVFADIDIVIGGNLPLQRSDNALLNPVNILYNPALAQEYINANQESGVESEGIGVGLEFDIDRGSEIMLLPLNPPLMVPKASTRGRLVTRLDITMGARGGIVDYYAMQIQVSDAYADDPHMDRIARGYDTEVHSTELRTRVERKYVGSAACEECHPGYNRAWSDHGHFTSYQTIANAGSLGDRECTRCHAIGFMEEPRLLTYDLIPETHRNVGCEGCHANGYQHIAVQEHTASLDPESEQNSTITDPMSVGITTASCIKCHTSERDEDFDFDMAIEAARAICQSIN